MFPARRRDAPSGVYRPEWYDRNPANVSLRWADVSVSPHSTTIRASYTVPTGKSAFIMGALAWLQRETAPTSAGFAGVYVYLTNRDLVRADLYSSSVGAKDSMVVGLAGIALSGESVDLCTFDLSTGGTFRMIVSVLLTRFDA